MAGFAESCTHVRALLFRTEAAVRIRGNKTVTDVPAYWMMLSIIHRVQGEEAHKIDISTGAAKKKNLNSCVSEDRRPSGIQTRAGCTTPCEHSPTLSDLRPLLDILHTHTKAVCLSGMEDYYKQYADPVQPHILTSSLCCHRDPSKDGVRCPSSSSTVKASHT